MIIEKLLGKHLNDINLSDYAHVLHTSSPNNWYLGKIRNMLIYLSNSLSMAAW